VPKWEYMTWTVTPDMSGNNPLVATVNGRTAREQRRLYEALCEAGADGWELVSTGEFRLIFKRPSSEG
jgi:hypothetical protein